jgi:hypothetical protein
MICGMRKLLLALIVTLGLSARAQSIWLEAGLGYIQEDVIVYSEALKLGLRSTRPFTDAEFGPESFIALAWREGLIIDLGGWFPFLPGATDPFGLRAYAGTGLSFVRGEFGLALSIAFSYELERDVALAFVYTHRPIVYPRLAQAFDGSLGLRLALP